METFVGQRRTDPQLVRFCNEDLLLPEHVDADRVEAQFADGFLIGCVVAAISPICGHKVPKGFVESLSRHDETTVGRLDNFEKLKPQLQALGVKFDQSLLDDICTEQRSAASRVLLQLKSMFDIATGAVKYDPPAQRIADPLGERAIAAGAVQPNKVGGSVRQRMVATVRDMPFVNRLMMSGLSHKEIALELHTAKFEEFRLENLKRAEAADQLETAEHEAKTLEKIAHQIDLERERSHWHASFDEKTRTVHDLERSRQIRTEQVDLAYEMSMMERDRVLKHNAVVLNKRETRKDLDGFEATYRRLGMDKRTEVGIKSIPIPGVTSVAPVNPLPPSSLPATVHTAKGEQTRRGVVGGVSAQSIARLAPRPAGQQAAKLLARAIPDIDEITLVRASDTLSSLEPGTAPLFTKFEDSLAFSSATGKEAPQDYLERMAASFAATFRPREAVVYGSDLRSRIRVGRVDRRDKDTRGRLMRAFQSKAQAETDRRVAEDADVLRYLHETRQENAEAEAQAAFVRAQKEREANGIAWAKRQDEKLNERFRERAAHDRAHLEEERAQKEKDDEPLRKARLLARNSQQEAFHAENEKTAYATAQLLLDVAIEVISGLGSGNERGILPTDWRRIKKSFVDGSIGDARMRANSDKALKQLQDNIRPASLPKMNVAPDGLSLWGVIVDDHVAGTNESVEKVLARLSDEEASNNRFGTSEEKKNEEDYENEETEQMEDPAKLLKKPLDTLLGDLFDRCDLRDWEQCIGSWTLPGAAVSTAYLNVSRRNSRASRGSVGDGSPSSSPSVDRVEWQDQVLAAAAAEVKDSHLSSVNSLESPQEGFNPLETLSCASYELDAFTDETSAKDAAVALHKQLSHLERGAVFLGPPLRLPKALRIIAAPPDVPLGVVEGESATVDINGEGVPGSLILDGAVPNARLPPWASYSRMQVAKRLCARLRATYISPLSIVLSGVLFFDAENKKLLEQSGGTLNLPGLTSLPSVPLSNLTSIAQALAEIFPSTEVGAHSLAPSQFLFRTEKERVEAEDSLYRLGAYVAAHISTMQKAILRMCGVESASSPSDPKAAAVKDINKPAVQFSMGRVPEIEELDGIWKLNRDELVVCDVAVMHSDIEKSAVSLCAARSIVKAAILAASGKRPSSTMPPAATTKTTPVRPGVERLPIPLTGPFVGYSATDVDENLLGSPVHTATLVTRLSSTTPFAHALSVCVAQAERKAILARSSLLLSQRAIDPPNATDDVPSGYGGWLLEGLPASAAHSAAIEYAVTSGSLVWGQNDPLLTLPDASKLIKSSLLEPLPRPSQRPSSSLPSSAPSSLPQTPLESMSNSPQVSRPGSPNHGSSSSSSALIAELDSFNTAITAPENWDKTLSSLLAKLESGSWVVPRSGVAAQDHWDVITNDINAKEQAQKLAEEELAAPRSPKGSKGAKKTPSKKKKAPIGDEEEFDATAARAAIGPRPTNSSAIHIVITLPDAIPDSERSLSSQIGRIGPAFFDVLTGLPVSNAELQQDQPPAALPAIREGGHFAMPDIADRTADEKDDAESVVESVVQDTTSPDGGAAGHPPASKAVAGSKPASRAASATKQQGAPPGTASANASAPVTASASANASGAPTPRGLNAKELLPAPVLRQNMRLVLEANEDGAGIMSAAGAEAFVCYAVRRTYIEAATLGVGFVGSLLGSEDEGDDSIVRCAGACELLIENLAEINEEASSSSYAFSPRQSHQNEKVIALLMAAGRGVNGLSQESGEMLYCAVSSYKKCKEAYIDAAMHVLTQLRTTQLRARAQLRRIGRAYLRMLRGIPDHSIPERFVKMLPQTELTSLKKVAQQMVAHRVKAADEAMMRKTTSTKSGRAHDREAAEAALLLPRPKKGAIERGGGPGVIESAEAGITNRALLKVAAEVASFEVEAAMTKPNEVVRLCNEANEAGSLLWAATEAHAAAAKSFLDALCHDHWLDSVQIVTNSLISALMSILDRTCQDSLSLLAVVNSAVVGSARADYASPSFLARLESKPTRTREPYIRQFAPQLEQFQPQLPLPQLEAPLSAEPLLRKAPAYAELLSTQRNAFVTSLSHLGRGDPAAAPVAAVVASTWRRAVSTACTGARMHVTLTKSREEILEWCAKATRVWLHARNSGISGSVSRIQAVLRASADPQHFEELVSNEERAAKMALAATSFQRSGGSVKSSSRSGDPAATLALASGHNSRLAAMGRTAVAVAEGAKGIVLPKLSTHDFFVGPHGVDGLAELFGWVDLPEKGRGGGSTAPGGSSNIVWDAPLFPSRENVNPVAEMSDESGSISTSAFPPPPSSLAQAFERVRKALFALKTAYARKAGEPAGEVSFLDGDEDDALSATESLNLRGNIKSVSSESGSVYSLKRPAFPPGLHGVDAGSTVNESSIGKSSSVYSLGKKPESGARHPPIPPPTLLFAGKAEDPTSYASSLFLFEANHPSQRITGKGILALTKALLEVAEADEKASDEVKDKEARNAPAKRTVTSAGGAAILDSSELEEARSTGLLTAGRQLSRAVQEATQALSDSNFISGESIDEFGSTAASLPSSSSSSLLQKETFPSAWLKAPSSVWQSLARMFAWTPAPGSGGFTYSWSLTSIRRLVMALTFTRLRSIPTPEQLLLQRRNLVKADRDGDGFLTKTELASCLLFFETPANRAAEVISKADLDAVHYEASIRFGGISGEDLPPATYPSPHAPLVAGSISTESAQAQGGNRDMDTALVSTLLAPTTTLRYEDSQSLREAIWLAFCDSARNHEDSYPENGAPATKETRRPRFDSTAFIMSCCSDPRSSLAFLPQILGGHGGGSISSSSPPRHVDGSSSFYSNHNIQSHVPGSVSSAHHHHAGSAHSTLLAHSVVGDSLISAAFPPVLSNMPGVSTSNSTGSSASISPVAAGTPRLPGLLKACLVLTDAELSTTRGVGGIGVGSPVLRPRAALSVGVPVSSALILLGYAAGVSPACAPRLKSRTASERNEELQAIKTAEAARILAWLEINVPPLAAVAKELIGTVGNSESSIIPVTWFIKRANVWQAISILPFFFTSPLDLIPPVKL
jgi:hypothetical protein